MKKAKNSPQGGPVMVRQQSAVLMAAVALLAGVFLGWQGAVMVLNQEAAQGGQAGMHQQQPQGGMPQQGGMGGMSGMNSPLMAQAKAMEDKAAKNPNDPKVWTDLGNTYFDAELPDRAVAAYQKSLALNPAQPNVWTDMGVMLRLQGKPQEALKAFQQAASLDAKHEQSRLNTGVVLLFDLNDKAGALKAWQDLLAVKPDARMPDGRKLADVVKELQAK